MSKTSTSMIVHDPGCLPQHVAFELVEPCPKLPVDTLKSSSSHVAFVDTERDPQSSEDFSDCICSAVPQAPMQPLEVLLYPRLRCGMRWHANAQAPGNLLYMLESHCDMKPIEDWGHRGTRRLTGNLAQIFRSIAQYRYPCRTIVPHLVEFTPSEFTERCLSVVERCE